MNLILFIVMISVSFIAVRIGAIAFQLTGLEWSLAKFQGLSCFTGTGFTTREAELIVGNPQRRKIASLLMIFGNAGLVALIATFANSLRTPAYVSQLKIPFIHLFFAAELLPWINLIIIVAILYGGYRLFTHTKILQNLTDKLRKRIVKKEFVKGVTFEELMVSTGGYGVSNIEVNKKSPILNKTIHEAALRGHDITVLVIERMGETIPNPKSDAEMLLGDRVVCFGKLDNIKKEMVGDEKVH
ncbi:MAG: hypothetical protein P9L90_02115 [Candidatus Aadella gelida]|nr:hypothetical protein [Candidatus Aadella gelida]